jgi:outer membrane biosynthesis protein TonB
MAISFVVHALIILMLIRLTAEAVLPEHSPLGDAIQMVLGGGGGGGGQGGQAFQHATVPPPPPTTKPPPVVPPPPPPVPTVIPPPPAAEPPPAAVQAPAAAASSVAAAGTGTGTGGGSGTGTGTGTGSGQGPGTGSGTGGGTGGGNGGFPPVNKQMIVPPIEGVPKELRGKTVEVTFYVTAAGLVSEIKVVPAIANKGFSQKFDEIMRGYVFTPGRDAAGNKVPGVVTFQITFGSK